jgi:hypothetical protein
MIRFACPSCSFALSAPEDCAGRQSKCRQCGSVVSIPQRVPERKPSASVSARPLVIMAGILLAGATLFVCAGGSIVAWFLFLRAEPKMAVNDGKAKAQQDDKPVALPEKQDALPEKQDALPDEKKEPVKEPVKERPDDEWRFRNLPAKGWWDLYTPKEWLFRF